MASKTADQAASVAATEIDACGDDAGNQQYGDPWDTNPAAVVLRLLRAEDNRKSPPPAHATPAAKGAPSTNEVARQLVYEAAFDLCLKQRETDQGLDRMAQRPVPLIPRLQQQLLAGPLHPVPSSCSSSEVSLVPGIMGQPSLRDACFQGPPPHQGNSGSTSVSSSVQLQPTPTPRGSSGSGAGASWRRPPQTWPRLPAPPRTSEPQQTASRTLPRTASGVYIAVKLPPFWEDWTEVRMAQVEAQFFLAHITQDRTRYDYVVAHLDARYANEFRDILANSPTANLYEHLKTELIRRLPLSED
ncbi:hypothetical protein HPB49_020193 [Dermacentor silvarum]|uniref:Uncharacterized protein n=1 Tax=Dermacentor silvarum TaxID=543639 RepID=A0ACB8DKL0_DERSI|nr:hypothetical protein HPB49_020193 [Dermacentor silvarum]